MEGWPYSPKLEALREDWLDAADAESRKRIAVTNATTDVGGRAVYSRWGIGFDLPHTVATSLIYRGALPHFMGCAECDQVRRTIEDELITPQSFGLAGLRMLTDRRRSFTPPPPSRPPSPSSPAEQFQCRQPTSAATFSMPFPALRCVLMAFSTLGDTLGRPSFLPSWRTRSRGEHPAVRKRSFTAQKMAPSGSIEAPLSNPCCMLAASSSAREFLT